MAEQSLDLLSILDGLLGEPVGSLDWEEREFAARGRVQYNHHKTDSTVSISAGVGGVEPFIMTVNDEEGNAIGTLSSQSDEDESNADPGIPTVTDRLKALFERAQREAVHADEKLHRISGRDRAETFREPTPEWPDNTGVSRTRELTDDSIPSVAVDSIGTADEIGGRLWNADVSILSYIEPADKYQSAVLEQYKLYVEMADRVGSRRANTNALFIVFNTALFVLTWVFIGSINALQALPVRILIALVVILQCYGWFHIIRSYRQLNSAKYFVVGALERRLPASPYWRAEWTALGEGRDPRKYLPITLLEQWLPLLFAVVQLIGLAVPPH